MVINLEDLLKISETRKLELFVPLKGDQTENQYITNLFKNISEKGRKPKVLWNLRPWDNFNFIHLIYCSKLKQLIEIGFDIQIIIYDRLVEKILKLSTPKELDNLKSNVFQNIEWLTKSGLNYRNTEFLWESVIWKNINFDHFSNTVTSIAQLFENNQKSISVSDLLDRIWELYYEIVIDCDFIITGGKDAKDIWGVLRQKMLKDTLLFNYEPPIVLVFPTINGLNGKRIEPSVRKESLTINDNFETISYKIQNAQDDFLFDIVELLILPLLKNNIKMNGVNYLCHSYQEMKNKFPDDQIKELITITIFAQFKQLKNE